MDLVNLMLKYDPGKRVTAYDVSTLARCYIRLLATAASSFWMKMSLMQRITMKNIAKLIVRSHVLIIQALHHSFFTSLPRPTPPIQLPKPYAELRPRALAPEELNGKPIIHERKQSAGVKRGAAEPEDGEGLSGDGGRKVARRLF